MIEFTKSRGLPIGAVSRRTGVNIETVRYYEKIGLLPKPERSAGGNRIYSLELVGRLHFVKRSRDLGFSLAEIRELLALVDGGAFTCGEIHAIAERQIGAIQAKVKDLRRLERVLKEMADECSRGVVPDCPIIEALSEI